MLVHELAELALGSRLRGLSDRLFDAVDEVYRAQGSRVQSRWFPFLRSLLDHGPQNVSALAERLGQTHAAVSQLARKLEQQGLIERGGDARDQRRSVLGLSPLGERELAALKPLWGSIREAMREAMQGPPVELLDVLSAFEAELDRIAPAERIRRHHARRRSADVRIVPYAPALREAFYRINAEWLNRYYCIEEIDHRVLTQPEEHILRGGGLILFALLDDEAVGTCALLQESPGVYELTKMAVTERCQGLGIGRKLLEAVIERFHELGGSQLFLESHGRLQAALHLYESLGFVHQPHRRPDSHYQRSDVYMIYRPAEAA
ncbi:MAG: bifunctional helix-turn-helix transcriptional regulator/GNAT family N-acetyltransferase [Xanthomonadales bacterium]|nr:bifunctional helix-turn-helix transcriptional regulator/GNAT family N-acetyltransferase [Xanthomonadales bacterium]